MGFPTTAFLLLYIRTCLPPTRPPTKLGLYSSEGWEECSACEAGHYCGSNETSTTDMNSGEGSWESASSIAGVCFNGTYCAEGMTRAPGKGIDCVKCLVREYGRARYKTSRRGKTPGCFDLRFGCYLASAGSEIFPSPLSGWCSSRNAPIE